MRFRIESDDISRLFSIEKGIKITDRTDAFKIKCEDRLKVVNEIEDVVKFIENIFSKQI